MFCLLAGLLWQTCQIDEQELATALQGLEEEITPDRLHELMLSIDADGSGEIDFGEFLGVRGSRQLRYHTGV